MEGVIDTSPLVSSPSRPRKLRSRLELLTILAVAVAAIVLISGFVYKSVSVDSEPSRQVLVVNTANLRKSGVTKDIPLPHRTDRGDEMASTGQRNSWPHLVGQNAEEAKKKIQEDHPHLQVVILPQDSFMTMDYNLRRVRIFKDANQKVAKVPTLG
ncbi:hypothetical protein Mapa_009487 [Marchantia paleacea]|nr:hypothetical protein Mapa_009487 [Marchantia paleacea]